MPRQQSESAHYLNVYKLTIEKKRLHQELASLGQRRDRIQERLYGIEQQIQELDHKARRCREPRISSQIASSEPNSVVYPPAGPNGHHNSEDYKTVTLDY